MTQPSHPAPHHPYLAAAPRQVPGHASLLRMMTMLLAERVPPKGRVLVLGAGGGLELRAFAEAQLGWVFDGIDPSADMLKLAAETVEPHRARIQLHEGYIDAAPLGPYDGATSLLIFHFIKRDQRVATLREIRRRLKPGAPLVLAHISFPQTEPKRSQWIARHVAYGAPDGADPTQLAAAREAIGTRLTILAPEEETAMLSEAGFADISLFYASLSFKGWVAYAK